MHVSWSHLLVEVRVEGHPLHVLGLAQLNERFPGRVVGVEHLRIGDNVEGWEMLIVATRCGPDISTHYTTPVPVASLPIERHCSGGIRKSQQSTPTQLWFFGHLSPACMYTAGNIASTSEASYATSKTI